MVQKSTTNSSIKQAGFGLTAFMQTVAFSVCFAAVTGQGLISALVCIISCAAFSLITTDNICTPTPLLIVPFFFVCENTSPLGAFISISTGAMVFLLINKLITRKRNIPDHIIASTMLGLCIGATIILTNSYFGIGAFGATPLEMLKSYRSLGFHPHFMGLLTGTITLFTMITYPFKFRKLSKIIPASFITIAIPYILNLWLNPSVKYTAINEAVTLTPLQNIQISDIFSLPTKENIFIIIEGGIAFLWLFIVMSDTIKKQKLQICNIFSPFPTTATPITHYGLLSAIIVITLTILSFALLPLVFTRLPVHSAGAMLIVAAWQGIPYKKIATSFKNKEKRTANLICFFICAISFIVFNVYIATLISIIATNISTPVRKEKKNNG